VHGVVEIPIPEFYPNLCVMNDDDYQEAWEIIHKVLEEEKALPGEDVTCSKCGEKSPSNFGECFACQSAFNLEKSC